ncbi:hypothetical protein [uncultured Rikenella sp.]|uniref:hypothetical protein n=1 Tax=uncultured Rikenella sp. TaxID=368003 RepID=UPI00260BA0B6|nr:hypothetical protein [uncultured Rikenella sp.]
MGSAPGFRDAGYNGRLDTPVNVGNSGYSWSSADSGSNSLFLYFNTQNFNPSNVSSRGHGFPLRCLSE